MFPGIGCMLLTRSIDVLRNINLGPMARIINMDEDGMLPEAPDIIGGTLLLPPIEAKIAEADGNEGLFDSLYVQHLTSPNVKEYVAALMSYLYRGGNLIIFLPDQEYTVTLRKFVEFMFSLYGIHIGVLEDPQNSNCFYISSYIPLWLDMIYSTRVVMDCHEYLYMYPIDIPIVNLHPAIIGMLLTDIRPLGDTLEERIGEIEKLRKILKVNPNAREAIVKC